MGEVVSESVFDSLLGTSAAPPFLFGQNEQGQLDEAPCDFPTLVGRYKLHSV